MEMPEQEEMMLQDCADHVLLAGNVSAFAKVDWSAQDTATWSNFLLVASLHASSDHVWCAYSGNDCLPMTKA